MTNDEIEKEAIRIVSNEKTSWDTGSAFVTEKVSFEMRNVIKRARKNYFGIFDDPIDRNTGLEKIWVPLTEWVVETFVKNIDLDTKDINLRANKPKAVRLTAIARQILKNFLEKLNFGELLDDGQRSLAIDGTWVQKSFKGFNEEKKKQTLKTTKVDLLNFWIDPTAKDIQSAYSVIERALLTPTDIEKYKDNWINTDKIQFRKDIQQTEGNFDILSGEVPVIDIYERWGKMPKSLITGKDEDKNVWIDGCIIVSGLGSGKAVVHKIFENKGRQKPYEEVWLKRAPNRWYGRGLPEQLFCLQQYLNEVVNIRRNNNLVLQNKIWEIRKGSGITPQQLAKLVAGGGIPVTMLGQDIREIPVSDTKPSSYKDEEVIYSWGQRVSGAYEITAGEQMPSTQTATSVMIQQTSAKTAYTLVQEGIGMFLKRLIERHWLPIIWEVISDDEIINLIDDSEKLRVFDEMIIEEKMAQWIYDYAMQTGFMPEESEKQRMVEKMKNELKKMSKGRFIKFKKSLIDIGDYDVDIYVTNEDFDKAVAIQNLNTMLTTYGQLTESGLDTDAIMKEILDVMGIDGERFFKKEKVVKQPVNMPQGQTMTPQQQFTNANLPNMPL